jgi:hypothetical protein
MKNDIHRHLDGDIPADALEGEDRTIVDEWDRMVSAFRQAAPRSGTPQWLEQRVMAEIDSLPARGPLYRLFDWLVSPAPLRVSPLVAGLAAVGIVLAVMLPGRSAPQADVGPSAAGAASEVIYVQFLLEAPTATSVAVAGDFNDWQPSFTLDDVDGDGLWSGRIPVRPGVHAYMFVVDETEWRTDPNAGRYQDDGFGNQNAVLAVGTSG